MINADDQNLLVIHRGPAGESTAIQASTLHKRVARAESATAILGKERKEELARLAKEVIGSLSRMHELAEQAGIELPGVLGKVGGNRLADTTTEPKPTEETVDAVESD